MNSPHFERTRRLARGLVACGLTAACLIAFPVASAGAADCPNAAIRTQQHADRLPECRAYEQVTPLRKAGGEVFIEYLGQPVKYNVAAAAAGGAVSYASQSTIADQASGPVVKSYTAYRGDAGWLSTTNDAFARGDNGRRVDVLGFSDDLSKAVVAGLGPALVEGASANLRNFYLRDLASGSYTAITRALSGPGPEIAA